MFVNFRSQLIPDYKANNVFWYNFIKCCK